jgi:protein phosphatase
MIELPTPALIALCGSAASGKSTWARARFADTEIVSSDNLRAAMTDDPSDQSIHDEVFDVLQRIVDVRLRKLRLCVVDATNLHPHARAPLLRLAAQHRVPAVLVRFAVPLETRIAWDADRRHPVGPAVLRQHEDDERRLDALLPGEGWDHIVRLDVHSLDAPVKRQPLPPHRFEERGPFDVIGDVHGCLDELRDLLRRLGYEGGRHPGGRRPVFVGDLVDRGPASVPVLAELLPWLADGRALWAPGNHDDKLRRWFAGRPIQVSGGLATTVAELEALPSDEFAAIKAKYEAAYDVLPPYLWLDGGSLLVAHGGLEERDHGRVGAGIRAFCLYGKTTGRTVDGYPERLDWAADYRGRPAVVYGHVPVAAAEWRNGTAGIDLGCVFGGKLCAMRWPERSFVTVDAKCVYWARREPRLGVWA